jgi:superoxide dismutase
MSKKKRPFSKPLPKMLRDLTSVPEDIRDTVQNNGGGHLKHTIFWQIMSPQGGGQINFKVCFNNCGNFLA